MAPTLVEGMHLLVEQAEPGAIRTADIILYRRNEQMVVHRVIRASRRGGEAVYMTKGDNQGYAGIDHVAASDVIGVVRRAFSEGGRAVRLNTACGRVGCWAMGVFVSLVLAGKRYSPKPVRRIFGPFIDLMFK